MQEGLAESNFSGINVQELNLFKKILLLCLKPTLSLLTGGEGRGRLCILNYHRILEQPDPIRDGDIDVRTFDWQMALISSFFNVLPLGEAVKQLKDGTLPPRAICVTFDDGYADNEVYALPVLRKYGITATFFVASGYIDKGIMWNDTVTESIARAKSGVFDLNSVGLGSMPVATAAEKTAAVAAVLEKLKYLAPKDREKVSKEIGLSVSELPKNLMLTRAQIQTLHNAGMEIGCHTVSHPILAYLTLDEARREIKNSKQALEEIVSAEISLFAYPNGMPGRDYTQEHIKLVEELGFVAAVSTIRGVSTQESDIWQLPRFRPWQIEPLRFMFNLWRNYFVPCRR